jgi:glyceraldehyde 3-phosphate dehydrogenase
MARIAINGFGRIGRTFFRVAFAREDLDIVALNDLGDVENLAYLLKYDTVYKKYDKDVKTAPGKLIVDGKEVAFFQEKDPAKLPWKDLGVDIVVESSGVFTKYDQAELHLKAGAKRVVISAPAKKVETVLLGINEDKLREVKISNNGSCTTNVVSPVMAILSEKLGIKKAILNTCHAYTAKQGLVDGPAKKELRRGRAAACNISPASTGAATAVTEAVTSLTGRFDGIALRVPIVCGSIADITFLASRKTDEAEVNKILEEASKEERWKGIIEVSHEPLVSSDIVGDLHPCIVDSEFTKVVDGDLVKVLAWYDNELAYSWTLAEHVARVAKLL